MIEMLGSTRSGTWCALERALNLRAIDDFRSGSIPLFSAKAKTVANPLGDHESFVLMDNADSDPVGSRRKSALYFSSLLQRECSFAASSSTQYPWRL